MNCDNCLFLRVVRIKRTLTRNLLHPTMGPGWLSGVFSNIPGLQVNWLFFLEAPQWSGWLSSLYNLCVLLGLAVYPPCTTIHVLLLFPIKFYLPSQRRVAGLQASIQLISLKGWEASNNDQKLRPLLALFFFLWIIIVVFSSIPDILLLKCVFLYSDQVQWKQCAMDLINSNFKVQNYLRNRTICAFPSNKWEKRTFLN